MYSRSVVRGGSTYVYEDTESIYDIWYTLYPCHCKLTLRKEDIWIRLCYSSLCLVIGSTSEIYATVISLGVTESVYMCDLLLYAISFSKSLCLLLFTDITNWFKNELQSLGTFHTIPYHIHTLLQDNHLHLQHQRALPSNHIHNLIWQRFQVSKLVKF